MGGAPASLYESRGFYTSHGPCMVHTQTIQHAVLILNHWYSSALEFLLSRLAHPPCPAVPHALPSHMPWLSRPMHPPSRLACQVPMPCPLCLTCPARCVPHAPPVVSHMPCLSAHGVEPSVCGPLPYPLSSLELPCPARRQAPARPLQRCCHQHPATHITFLRLDPSPPQDVISPSSWPIRLRGALP